MSKVFGLPAFRPSRNVDLQFQNWGEKSEVTNLDINLQLKSPNEFGIFFILESRGLLSLLALGLVSADPCLDEAVAPSARQNLATGSEGISGSDLENQ